MQQIDTAELSPGEFAHRVRAAVEKNGARTVVIDSLNGYQQAMPEENSLDPPHARIASVPQSLRSFDLSDGCPAWARGRNESSR